MDQRQAEGWAGKGPSGIDKEISSRLGLTVEEIVEIRCIAENEMISLESYPEAMTSKRTGLNGFRQ